MIYLVTAILMAIFLALVAIVTHFDRWDDDDRGMSE